jgi:hypothetical protein
LKHFLSESALQTAYGNVVLKKTDDATADDPLSETFPMKNEDQLNDEFSLTRERS